MKEYANGKITAVRDGPVTIITINRAEVRNALDDESAQALGVAFREFDADPEQQVAVLTGVGGAFCAGADLKALSKREPGVYLAWAGDAEGPTNPTLSKPVITAVEGHAVAGGLGLALWCDIRIIDEDSVFGVFCRRFGVPMSDGTTVRLPRLIGMSRALDMMITGRAVTGQEAIEWGLATRMAPKGQTLEAARELAHAVAKFPPLAMKGDRQSVYEQQGLDLYAAFAREKELAEDAKQNEANASAKRFAEATLSEKVWPQADISARSLGNKEKIEKRLSLLDAPHMHPLNKYVTSLRKRKNVEVPDFDPLDGGTNARALFLFEKPGPMTAAAGRGKRIGSGFISRDNDDPSAEATFNFMRDAGIPRDFTILWNVVPWWNRSRNISRDELREGVDCVTELIDLLPYLRAVVFVEKKAAKARTFIENKGLACFSSGHPSPLVRAKWPRRWRAISSDWAKVSDLVNIEMTS